MVEVKNAARIQACLRADVAHGRRAVHVGPFTAFLSPDDATTRASVAVPDVPVGDDDAVVALRELFGACGERARVEFADSFAPELDAILRRAGLVEESRLPLMACTPDTLRPTTMPGLKIDVHTADTPLDEIRVGLDTNELGFTPNSDWRATDAVAEQFRLGLEIARAFVARLGSVPVAAGMFTAPVGGAVLLVGLTTLESYRRRGIAAALTVRIVEVAFEQGCDAVFLRAADEASARVYERVGFQHLGSSLAFTDAPTGAPL